MNCPELRDHYELFALGLADEPERSEIREHLNRGCEVCMAGTRKATELTALLGTTANSAAPSPKLRRRIFGLLQAEFDRTERAILAVTGQKQILGREPVLLRSVQLRNPYIDPLNYLQVEMMRRLRSSDKLGAAEADAVRAVVELTINGISGGLKNTG